MKRTMLIWVGSVTLLHASAASALPLIQELMYDAVGTDAPGVFTELAGTAGFDFSGWSLAGINGTDGTRYRTVDLTGAIMPDDGILVIATSSANATLAGARDWIGSVDWQNGPDAVQLVNPDGIIVDAIQYGDAGLFNAGEGMWAADVLAGQSLARDYLSTDTNDNLADFGVFDAPTPGSIPGSPEPVPEPGTIALVGLGLAGVRRFARNRSRSA